MDDEDEGLMSIYVSDEEDPVARKAQRNQQAEEDFQAVKQTYRARVENGDVRNTRLRHELKYTKRVIY